MAFLLKCWLMMWHTQIGSSCCYLFHRLGHVAGHGAEVVSNGDAEKEASLVIIYLFTSCKRLIGLLLSTFANIIRAVIDVFFRVRKKGHPSQFCAWNSMLAFCYSFVLRKFGPDFFCNFDKWDLSSVWPN